MITIVLAEDHQIVRQGLRAMLKTKADFSILDEVGDGLTVLQQVEHWQPAWLSTPDSGNASGHPDGQSH